MSSSIILRNYIKDTEWCVGALFAHDQFIINLYDKCRELNISFPIKYVFGGLVCHFHGGRLAPYSLKIDDACEIIREYNKRGIFCRLTFSNPDVHEKDLNDYIGNKLLEVANSYKGNGVYVSSDILAKYIREKYSNLEVIASSVKVANECELGVSDTLYYYKKVLDVYDKVVVNVSRVLDGELDSLDLNRVIVIPNSRCIKNCPMCSKHYKLSIELDMLAENNKDYKECEESLKELVGKCNNTHLIDPLNTSLLSISDVNMLVDKGIRSFELEGREYNGITFIRDIGHWIFNPDGPYLSIVRAIQGGNI